jgi:signal peptidase I
MSEELEEKKECRLHWWISVVLTVVLALTVGLCLYIVIQVMSRGYANLGGFMMFRVVTGSMEPTIPTGALLIAREVDIASIKLDDIVCFRTQVSEIWGKIVTHRVVGLMQSEAGSILLETKGDANLVSDIFFVDQSNLIGKVVWYTGDKNAFASLISIITNKNIFLGCIVFPTLVISGLILKDSVAGIRKDMMLMLEEARRMEQVQVPEVDPVSSMTQEEYNEMYERIRAELMEELLKSYEGMDEKNTGEDSTGVQ